MEIDEFSKAFTDVTGVTPRAETVSIYKELARLDGCLESDVRHWLDALSSDPSSQPIRRAFVKSVVSYLEGSTYSIGRSVLRLYSGKLTEIELSFLTGERYSLNKNGEVKVDSYYPSTAPLILFTFRMFAKAYDVELDLEQSQAGWSAVQETYHVRDALTHPKSADSLIVSDHHLLMARRAFNWHLRKMLEVQFKGLFEQADELKRAVELGQLSEDYYNFHRSCLEKSWETKMARLLPE